METPSGMCPIPENSLGKKNRLSKYVLQNRNIFSTPSVSTKSRNSLDKKKVSSTRPLISFQDLESDDYRSVTPPRRTRPRNSLGKKGSRYPPF